MTHFVDQVYQISDRVTIIRNGTLVGTFETASLSRIELITKMIGRTITALDEMSKTKADTAKRISTEKVLEARQLGIAGEIEPFDLELHPGEVFGLAGLVGSGRTETAGLLFGLETPDNGTLSITGKNVEAFSPHTSITRGLVLSPEDRKATGIVDDLTVRENIILALQAGQGWFNYLPPSRQYEIADRYIKLLDCHTISRPTCKI
jgi:simple sugar transport system ATP-binding protein